MKHYSSSEIEQILKDIEQMDQYTMCWIWRVAGEEYEIYFRTEYPTGKAFYNRLFYHFGGIPDDMAAKIEATIKFNYMNQEFVVDVITVDGETEVTVVNDWKTPQPPAIGDTVIWKEAGEPVEGEVTDRKFQSKSNKVFVYIDISA